MISIESMLARLAEGKQRFERSIRLQAAVWAGERPETQPLLLTCGPSAQFEAEWPVYNYLEIHRDREKMFSNGLRDAVLCALGGAEAVPSVRANMGCGVIPTMFGVEQMVFEDKMPWVRGHLGKGVLKEMKPGDLSFGGEMAMAFAHMDYAAQRLNGTGCLVFPLDLQGAFDTAHIVYGDDIFTDLYDDPDFVHHLLDLACHSIERGMAECLRHIPGSDETVAHYNSTAIPRSRGGVKISEDTSTLLSGPQINEFVAPYLHRLLRYFGGGYVHYCGSNPHLYRAVMGQELVIGLNFGNPERHDMDAVLRHCAAVGKVYYGTIPQTEGEGLTQYFLRILAAGGHGGRRWVLPVYQCESGHQQATADAWREACRLADAL